MRTNVVLDDELVREAMERCQVRTKRAVVDLALRELVRRARKKDLTDLAGKIRFAPGYDYKKLRATRRGRR